jgi:D-arabinose 1-dehydrogenase-like Zn-dependent alcohol dehydrogenase
MLSFDVVEWGAPLQKMERETPRPRGTEVLVQIRYCGVCPSDAHMRDNYFDLGDGKRFLMSERGMRLPVTLGHEALGTVIAAAPDATNVVIGTDRLFYPWTGAVVGRVVARI